MQNTSSQNLTWEKKQEVFISTLKPQPLILVLRPNPNTFRSESSKKLFFTLLEKLQYEGIRNIEIAWFYSNCWKDVIKEILNEFTEINLGAASVNSSYALNIVKEIGLNYAMTPFWNPTLIDQAKEISQLLIPGVFSPTEMYQAINKQCKIVKIFPAATLGFNYLNQLNAPIGTLPFIIAAGGVKIEDIDDWLSSGHNAIAIGKDIQEHQSIASLKMWINSYQKTK